MPQRLRSKVERLDTTVSMATKEKIEELARSIERAGRRYKVSMTEVVELAIDWAFSATNKGKKWSQPERDKRRDFRCALKMPTGTMDKLRYLGTVLMESDGYIAPPRTPRPGEPSLGDTIDWCVYAFHKGIRRTKDEPKAHAEVG